MELARESANQIEVLTLRINNGGADWRQSGVRVHTSDMHSPTESEALRRMLILPKLVERRDYHIDRVGRALAAIERVRKELGAAEGDILEMFYIDGLLSWEIANELNTTVDGVFYRKRKALRWMDENLTIPR